MFGRRRRAQPEPPGEDTPGKGARGEDAPKEPGEDAVVPAGQEVGSTGPYDSADQPADDRNRLDLGSLRLPVPEGAQLQVEVDKAGPVRAVHLMTGVGQITVTAFAAPRTAGLWSEVARELVAALRRDGATVRREPGEWGEEIQAVTPQGVLRFLAVDGPRWLLRGVAAGTAEQADARTALLRAVVRDTVVVRGPEPLPVRSPLPLQLPGPLADQIKQATSGGAEASGGQGGRSAAGQS